MVECTSLYYPKMLQQTNLIALHFSSHQKIFWMLVIKVLHTLHLAIVSYFACDCKNLSYLNLSNEQIIAYQENQNQSLLLCVPYSN